MIKDLRMIEKKDKNIEREQVKVNKLNNKKKQRERDSLELQKYKRN